MKMMAPPDQCNNTEHAFRISLRDTLYLDGLFKQYFS
jgi:hypothetical protein